MEMRYPHSFPDYFGVQTLDLHKFFKLTKQVLLLLLDSKNSMTSPKHHSLPALLTCPKHPNLGFSKVWRLGELTFCLKSNPTLCIVIMIMYDIWYGMPLIVPSNVTVTSFMSCVWISHIISFHILTNIMSRIKKIKIRIAQAEFPASPGLMWKWLQSDSRSCQWHLVQNPGLAPKPRVTFKALAHFQSNKKSQWTRWVWWTGGIQGCDGIDTRFED